MDVFDSNVAHANVVRPKAVDYIEKYKKEQFFAFFRFSDPDSAGHTYGENSKEYEDAVRTCDERLGVTVEELKENGLYGNTILYVTSDHGFDEGKTRHNNAPCVFICSSKSMKGGGQKDIVPTVLQDFGVNISEIRPKLSGKPLVSHSSPMYMIEMWNLIHSIYFMYFIYPKILFLTLCIILMVRECPFLISTGTKKFKY